MNRSRRVDRKVRCDGIQPCENCRRSGDTCLYSPTLSLTKADLFHTIEVLRGRVAEAQLLKQEQLLKSNPKANSGGGGGGGDFGDFSQFSFQMTPVSGPDDGGFLPHSNNMDASLGQFRGASEPNFNSCLPSPHTSTRGDAMDFAVDNVMSAEEANNSSNGAGNTTSRNGGSHGSPNDTRSNSSSTVSTPPQRRPEQGPNGPGCSP
ncbi:hypothetical protein PG984_015593 [Apiospora sp. TS-2023a]